MEAPVASETSVTFGLELPSSTAPVTRASGDKDMKIDKVTVLVFASGNDRDGRFLYGRTDLALTDSKFTANLMLSTSPVSVHVFANPPSGSITISSYTNKTEANVIDGITTNLDLIGSSTLPMHANTIFNSITLSKPTSATIHLVRSVARVDVAIAVATNVFQLRSISVHSTPTTGRLVSNYISSNVATAPTMPPSPLGTTNSTVTQTSQTIENKLFIYENTDNSESSSNKSSRIIVSGYYDNNTTSLRYYAIDFKKGDDFVDVLRNHKYTFTVTQVIGDGYDTAEEAAASAPVDIVVNLVIWTAVEKGEIIFDGVNHFRIGESPIVIRGDANVNGILTVNSNVDFNDWKMRWGTGGSAYSTAATISGSHFTVSKTASDLTFTTRANHSGTNKTNILYIEVADRLELQVTVNQYSGSALTVGGESSNFNAPTILHEGGMLMYDVVTSDPLVFWNATYVPSSPPLPIVDVNYYNMGVNDSPLIFNVAAHAGIDERKGVLTVTRGTTSSNIKINVSQEGAPLLTISPDAGTPSFADGLSFNAKKDQPSTFSYNVAITNSAAAQNYTWQATRTISSGANIADNDVYISRDNSSYGSTASGSDNDKLYVKVDQRELSDPNITGNISVSLVRKANSVAIETSKKSANYTLNPPSSYIRVFVSAEDITAANTGIDEGASATSLATEAEEATGYTIEVFDRNLGAPNPIDVPVALNYNETKPDVNASFRGTNYYFTGFGPPTITTNSSIVNHADNPCYDKDKGWRVPTRADLMAISKRIRRINHGTNDAISYIVGTHDSPDDPSGAGAAIGDNVKRCFFPMSHLINLQYPYGMYWSTTLDFRVYVLEAYISESKEAWSDQGTEHSVRCIKKVE